ncbi:hypothetical protein [Compostibacter hankyongensis]|uniref:Uncharacterized protein n=1 Tax=Compostibacter hankyongensis TaxID=1007089 RepID=A0ABP8FM31_9BACT
MSKKNVKQEIQQLAIGNYKSFPDEYTESGANTDTLTVSLAKGYWDSRSEKEVSRDERLGINLDDYTQWTKEAFAEFIKEYEGSLN